MKLRTRGISGTRNQAESERERAHRVIARKAAAEGIVLLENNGVLPLKKGSNVALYGGGARHTIKGGTGSGSVNNRSNVSIDEGLRNAGFTVTTDTWLDAYDAAYGQSYKEWKDYIYEISEPGNFDSLYRAHASHPMQMPKGSAITKTEAADAIYVISRISGEGADRKAEPGDYYLSEQEEEELKAIVAERHREEQAWAEANPEKAAQQAEWFSGKAPRIDWNSIEQKAGDATRNASAKVLGLLAEQVPNMICSSADLSNSDKTEGFLNKTHAFAKGDFSGAFLQAGVAELTMACCCIGMTLHGGVISACGTFFVFSDYMKPAIRMAALMKLPVKFIWSHDAFRVGEDGPTHQPVEQEAQIRLMEKIKNHDGKNSMLVLRPADVDETTVCWKLAMENTDTPTGLIFSRQNVNSLPAGTNYAEAARGAYIVSDSEGTPDVILVASGSEVSTLVAGAELLHKDGIKTRIVSVPSEGLFRSQSKEYQESIIPAGAKVFGLTAGLPVNLEGLVGANGKVWGLDSFGFSAPYKVLDEKLGFNAENVYNQVKAMF